MYKYIYITVGSTPTDSAAQSFWSSHLYFARVASFLVLSDPCIFTMTYEWASCQAHNPMHVFNK